MNTVPIDDAKINLDGLVTKVLDDAEPIALNAPSGETVVIMPLDDYSAWQETANRSRNE